MTILSGNHPPRPTPTTPTSHPGNRMHRTPSTAPSRLRLGSALAALLALPQVHGQTIPLAPEQQSALGIELAAPQATDRTMSRRYPAQVAVPVRQDHVVSAPQDGTLSLLLVALGESVTAGQPLARMQSPGLLEAQASLLEAQTRLTLSESELARDQALFKEGLVPKRRLQATQADHNALATSVDQWSQRLALSGMSVEAISALKQGRHLSATLELVSPIDGVVLEQMVNTGQAVAAATPLFRVASLSPLWLEVHVPIDQVAGLHQGDQVSLPREDIRGHILTIGRQVHGTDQGVLVRAEVREGADRLRPGQFVEVQLSDAGKGPGWRLPTAALVRTATAVYVFARRAEGFAAVPVQVLAQEERSAVVTGDISASDQVAVSGVAALKAVWLGGTE
jgi:membrane fusion protein, heavy metal efflux system